MAHEYPVCVEDRYTRRRILAILKVIMPIFLVYILLSLVKNCMNKRKKNKVASAKKKVLISNKKIR